MSTKLRFFVIQHKNPGQAGLAERLFSVMFLLQSLFVTIVRQRFHFKIILINKEGSRVMISYNPFRETLRASRESTYTLIKHRHQ
jgi:hypothetical protein